MQTFSKNERLCSLRLMQTLFKKGQTFYVFPFKVFFCLLDPNESLPADGLIHEEVDVMQLSHSLPILQSSNLKQWLPHRAQLLITVSKRNFKRATDRNRIKRLVREGYRKNKEPLQRTLQTTGNFCLLSLAYTSRNILTFSELEHKIVVILRKIADAAEAAAISDIQ